ncbi:glycosyltransferase family 9 protein [Roseateles violae]|uniref:Glycosyltransferase family 9 protein n=1 Tax=Roseateles violae TaxID=3058042 RepID=A0ABT8DYA7_9BURK|nr:glycosyltransferase family 9 protein [Pelomonas sp. PFR6]MDN3922349.1 glycosyltransferase family 9 protein [Pelomonas sp. PFR6]
MSEQAIIIHRRGAPDPAPAAPSADWSGVRRLLAVRLDNLGDLLMTTPALAALRESLPTARITLLTSPSGVAAQHHLSMVDAAIAFDAPWVRNGLQAEQLSAPGAAEAALLRQLGRQQYDAAVIFTTATQSALPMAMIARQAGIPLRLAHCRENPYTLLSDWVADAEQINGQMRHEVRRQLDLVARIGARTANEHLRFRLHPADQRRAEQRLQRMGIDVRQSYVLIHPGASAASRRWPAPRFGEAADLIARQTGRRIVFCGGPGESDAITKARAAMRRPSVAIGGGLSLGELAALIDGASLLICNNSAPAHLAAALGTPLVDLYALTNPQHRPWRVASRVLSHDVPCRWCLKSSCPERHNDCLALIEPAEVAAAALALLRTRRRYPIAQDGRTEELAA